MQKFKHVVNAQCTLFNSRSFPKLVLLFRMLSRGPRELSWAVETACRSKRGTMAQASQAAAPPPAEVRDTPALRYAALCSALLHSTLLYSTLPYPMLQYAPHCAALDHYTRLDEPRP